MKPHAFLPAPHVTTENKFPNHPRGYHCCMNLTQYSHALEEFLPRLAIWNNQSIILELYLQRLSIRRAADVMALLLNTEIKL